MRSVRLLLLALLLVTSVSLSAQAPELFPTFSITAGAYDAQFSTEVRVAEAAGEPATELELERDLGLPSSRRNVTFGLRWMPAARHELALAHRSADREGFETIDREIIFRGTPYPVNADVSSEFNTDTWEATYTWWIARRERAGIGLMLGASTISVDASIVATAPGATVSIAQDAETEVPVALAGLQGRFAFGPRLFAEASAAFLPEVEIDVYSGEAVSAAARLEYRFLRNVGAGIGWNYFRINGKVAETTLDADLDMQVQGAEAFVRFAF